MTTEQLSLLSQINRLAAYIVRQAETASGDISRFLRNIEAMEDAAKKIGIFAAEMLRQNSGA